MLLSAAVYKKIKMKKISLILSLFVLLFASSCKKTDNPNPLSDVSNLSVGSYLTLVENVNLNFEYDNPASAVSVKVDKYGADISKVVVYVVEGANSDPASWRQIKEVNFAGAGTVLSVTSQEVATALSVTVSELSAGNFYTFYNKIITTDGRTFDITNAGNALATNSNYNACFQWAAYITCPFTAPVGGNYEVIQDDWVDWYPGDVVNVIDGPGANQIDLSDVWPNAAIGSIVDHLVVNIDPATGTASVPFVTFGDYGALATAQGAFDNDVAGYVFSCTGFVTLTMKLTYNGVAQGNFKLVLRKL